MHPLGIVNLQDPPAFRVTQRYSNRTVKSMPKESPMSEALNWFSRILAVGVVMLALGWCGGKLDQWLGTKFIAVIGFLLGMTIGLIALIGILQRSNIKK